MERSSRSSDDGRQKGSEKPANASNVMKPDNGAVGISLSFPTFPPGATLEVCRIDGLNVTCTEGVLRGMLYHSQQGLPMREGGGRQDDTVEVAGALLGRVAIDGPTVLLAIEQIVPFPMEPDNREDRVVYTAEHAQMVDRALRRHEGLQELGDFHSHPNFDLRLSETDLLHFRERKNFNYFVAAVVRPRPDPEYKNRRVAGFFVKYGDRDFQAHVPPVGYVPYDTDGNPGQPRLARPPGVPELIRRARKLVTPRRAIVAGAAAVAVVVAAVLLAGREHRWRYDVPPISDGALAFNVPSPNPERQWNGEIVFRASENGVATESDTVEFDMARGMAKQQKVIRLSDLHLTRPWSRLDVSLSLTRPGGGIPYSSKGVFERKTGYKDVEVTDLGRSGALYIVVTAPNDMIGSGSYTISDFASGELRNSGYVTAGERSAETKLVYDTNYKFMLDYCSGSDLIRLEAVKSFPRPEVNVVMPERQPPTEPENPQPADGETGVAVTAELSWRQSRDPDGGRAVYYDVYLDTRSIPSDLPTSKRKAHDIKATHVDPRGDLLRGTKYYWQIVARDDDGDVTASDIWTFTTTDMDAPILVFPPAEGTNVALAPTLEWSKARGPSNSNVTYDVYLDTSNPPATRVAEGLSERAWTVTRSLQPGQQYYWRIKAESGAGKDVESVVWSFTTAGKVTTSEGLYGDVEIARIESSGKEEDKRSAKWLRVSGATHCRDLKKLHGVEPGSNMLRLCANRGPQPSWELISNELRGNPYGVLAWNFRRGDPRPYYLFFVLKPGVSLDEAGKWLDERSSIQMYIPWSGKEGYKEWQVWVWDGTDARAGDIGLKYVRQRQ